MSRITRQEVVTHTRELGADLVGIASAQVLNEHPPDPKWPQTPARFWPECRSVVVIANRVPWGIYHTEEGINRFGAPQMVHVKLDRIALDLAYYLEDRNCYAVPFFKGAVDTDLKKGSYGALSLRHLAVEAGLGTLGLNMMLLTPEYGPRVYLTCVLTNAELEADSVMGERLCLSPACDRCLLACPADAVKQWGLDKRRCRDYAQRYGYAGLLGHLRTFITAGTWAERKRLLSESMTLNLFQGLQSGVGTYAGCLRCVEVCPVGEDYEAHVSGRGTTALEPTPEKLVKAREIGLAERDGDHSTAKAKSSRWIGNAATTGALGESGEDLR